ncbi:MAG: lipopolysaccharide heptosyltransferase family protein [Betaproteobacteria bacterium]|nr:lipopolysaccharide heptosyltransferase family protein [Betaproteobacteria bacterium]
MRQMTDGFRGRADQRAASTFGLIVNVRANTVSDEPRILVVRPDSIGDVVCTTPLIAALRSKYPRTWIGVLANHYSAPVLAGNPDIDEVFAYRRSRDRDANKIALIVERIRVVLALRKKRIDYALIAMPTYQRRVIRFVRWSGAKAIAGFGGERDQRGRLDIAVPVAHEETSEVEDVFRLGAPLGVDGVPPALKVVPDSEEVAHAMTAVAATRRESDVLIGVHISARNLDHRWSDANYVATMRELAARHRAAFIVFWASESDRIAPRAEDNDRAQRFLDAASDLKVFAWPSDSLKRLIGGIAACDFMLMADGSAMHIAAALQKPIVCLFGRSDPVRWRPWGVPHELLRSATQTGAEFAVADVVAACERVMSVPVRPRAEAGHF